MKKRTHKSNTFSSLLVLLTAILVFALQGSHLPVFEDVKKDSNKEQTSEKKEKEKVETINFEATISSSFNLPQVYFDFTKPEIPQVIIQENEVEDLIPHFVLPFVKTTLTRIISINAP